MVARCDRGNRQGMVAERLQHIRFNRAQPCSTHAMTLRDPCHISARAERDRRQIVHMADDEVAQLRCRQTEILLEHANVALEQAQRLGILRDRTHEGVLEIGNHRQHHFTRQAKANVVGPPHHRRRQHVRVGKEHGIVAMVGHFSTALGDNASTLRAHPQSNIVIAVGDEFAGSAPVDWGKCPNPDAESRHCSYRRFYAELRAGHRLDVRFRDRPPEDFLKCGQPLAFRQFVG